MSGRMRAVSETTVLTVPLTDISHSGAVAIYTLEQSGQHPSLVQQSIVQVLEDGLALSLDWNMALSPRFDPLHLPIALGPVYHSR